MNFHKHFLLTTAGILLVTTPVITTTVPVNAAASQVINYHGQKNLHWSGRAFYSKKLSSFNNGQTRAEVKLVNRSSRNYRVNFKHIYWNNFGQTSLMKHGHRSIIIRAHSKKILKTAFAIPEQYALPVSYSPKVYPAFKYGKHGHFILRCGYHG